LHSGVAIVVRHLIFRSHQWKWDVRLSGLCRNYMTRKAIILTKTKWST